MCNIWATRVCAPAWFDSAALSLLPPPPRTPLSPTPSSRSHFESAHGPRASRDRRWCATEGSGKHTTCITSAAQPACLLCLNTERIASASSSDEAITDLQAITDLSASCGDSLKDREAEMYRLRGVNSGSLPGAGAGRGWPPAGDGNPKAGTGPVGGIAFV